MTDRPECYLCARRVPLAPMPGSAIPLCAPCFREAEAWDRYWQDIADEQAERARRRRAG
jgi:hypothetical protein